MIWAADSKPPKPEVTSGEFPFKLVYEINGETVTVEESYSFEYVGAKWNWNAGWSNEWDACIGNTGEEAVVMTQNGNTKIYASVGNVKYYLGGYEEPDYDPLAFYEYTANGRATSFFRLSEDELWEQYKIKIVSWEHSEPIENTFE